MSTVATWSRVVHSRDVKSRVFRRAPQSATMSLMQRHRWPVPANMLRSLGEIFWSRINVCSVAATQYTPPTANYVRDKLA